MIELIPDKPYSRMAPTPSGYLHLGNLLNFYLTWKVVREKGGTLELRIDDMDATRSRPEYVEDIFRSLEFLGIDWDEGPEGPDQFYAEYSQLKRVDYYREQLKNCPDTFVCDCSRSQIKAASPDGRYPGTCYEKNLSYRPCENCIRIKAESLSIGDFVLWRKDDLPAYQWVSLMEDCDRPINFILRGDDLRSSTEAQLYLAKKMNLTNFQNIHFIHHSLLTDPNGEKLSKSNQSPCLKDMTISKEELIQDLERMALQISFSELRNGKL